MEYTLIRSHRKTVALEVKPDLTVVVRAPNRMPKKQIKDFVERNREWLNRALEQTKKKKRI